MWVVFSSLDGLLTHGNMDRIVGVKPIYYGTFETKPVLVTPVLHPQGGNCDVVRRYTAWNLMINPMNH